MTNQEVFWAALGETGAHPVAPNKADDHLLDKIPSGHALLCLRMIYTRPSMSSYLKTSFN